MAKKFVRGVTGVDDIEKFDKTLTNVNDLISDGKNTYVHTKKGNNEIYYKITDSVNTIKSTNNTITVNKDENATVTLNTNPQKVLEHENLLTGYGIEKTFNNNTTTLDLQPLQVTSDFDVNTHFKGKVAGYNLQHAPAVGWFVYENDYLKISGRDYIIQTATRYKIGSAQSNEKYVRTLDTNTWTVWDKQITDETILATKQNTITNNTSIGVSGTGLQQLYSQKQSYSHTNGILKTHVKSVSANTNVTTAEEEFNFIVKINKGATSASFTLNSHDKTKFTNIMSIYGQANTVRISGLIFTLSGSNLTVTTANSVNHDYVITFSDII